MTEQPKATRPGAGFTLSPAVLRTLGWLLLRLTVASVVVTLVVWYLRVPLELLIARGARNLLALASSPYYLKTIEFIDGGYAYTSWLGSLQGAFKLPSLLFTFGFPIAYAFALPGFLTLRYWLRALCVVLIAYFVCVLSVAVVCDARLTATYSHFGITMQPPWRAESAAFVQYYLWMFTVRLYPLLMVIVLAVVSDQFRTTARREPSGAIRALNWTVLSTLAALLIVTIASDSKIDSRIERVERESVSLYVADIDEANRDLGAGLVQLGKFLEKRNDPKRAFQIYRSAMKRLVGVPRMQAREARDRVHEQIKAALLEKAEQRKARNARRQEPPS